MCDDGETLVRTRPGNAPCPGPEGVRLQRPACTVVKGRVRAAGVDQDVGVDRDHGDPRRASCPGRHPRTAATSRHPGKAAGQRARRAQALFDQRLERGAFVPREGFAAFRQVVRQFDRRLHRGHPHASHGPDVKELRWPIEPLAHPLRARQGAGHGSVRCQRPPACESERRLWGDEIRAACVARDRRQPHGARIGLARTFFARHAVEHVRFVGCAAPGGAHSVAARGERLAA
jgi:hypothetical protein